MGWLASQIYTFTIVALFFIASGVFYVFSKNENQKENVRKGGSVFMKIMINSLIIENFIGILSNTTCRKNELGESFVLNNSNMKCFSGEHIGLFIVSLIIFFFYFLFAILFYPSLYKISNETESFFNIEVLGKVMYACVVVFISDEYMNFKLIFTIFLISLFLSLSIFGYFQDKYDYNTMKGHVQENILLLWIYFWAILSYNRLASIAGFWILVITAILLTIESYFIIYMESCHNKLKDCLRVLQANRNQNSAQDARVVKFIYVASNYQVVPPSDSQVVPPSDSHVVPPSDNQVVPDNQLDQCNHSQNLEDTIPNIDMSQI
ncbi:hypothetical protein SteCoe_22449 [Stentor coeruleus]|uniref:Uncharacterized protein n=1 Tax=Stentor coeruleus TaxID=5963 RepID=A0A1R2BMA3_9CILI|nr:hypothetical protein SteCoe_22449 [Stentor coeruleus]